MGEGKQRSGHQRSVDRRTSALKTSPPCLRPEKVTGLRDPQVNQFLLESTARTALACLVERRLTEILSFMPPECVQSTTSLPHTLGPSTQVIHHLKEMDHLAPAEPASAPRRACQQAPPVTPRRTRKPFFPSTYHTLGQLAKQAD